MAQHFSFPVEDGVSPGSGFLLTLAAAFHLAVTFHRCLKPQASVWELKGAQKFACLCHPLYPFLMTSWITLTPLPQLPPGPKTWWQCGRQSRCVLWHCLVSKGAAGHRQSSSKKTTLVSTWFSFLEKKWLSSSYLKCRDNVRKLENCNHGVQSTGMIMQLRDKPRKKSEIILETRLK